MLNIVTLKLCFTRINNNNVKGITNNFTMIIDMINTVCGNIIYRK